MRFTFRTYCNAITFSIDVSNENDIQKLLDTNSGRIKPTNENTSFTSVYPAEKAQQIVTSIPMDRAGNVNDIAETCFFLGSDYFSYITGEIINVNGGWLFGR